MVASAVCVSPPGSLSCPRYGSEEVEVCNDFPCSFKEKEYGGPGKEACLHVCTS